MITLICSSICLLIGWFGAYFYLLRKKNMVFLKENQVVVVKPEDGMTMVAVPPDVLRKIVIGKYNYDEGEARAMVEKYAASQRQKQIEKPQK